MQIYLHSIPSRPEKNEKYIEKLPRSGEVLIKRDMSRPNHSAFSRSLLYCVGVREVSLLNMRAKLEAEA